MAQSVYEIPVRYVFEGVYRGLPASVYLDLLQSRWNQIITNE